MMEKHVEITIQVASEQQDVLMAQLLSIGFEGFEQGDDQLIAIIEFDQFQAGALKELLQESALPFTQKIIEKTNWNALWESNFEPVQVGNFVGVRANFHPPFEQVTHEIIITPKMSFGTGHHATTHLVMELMQSLNFENQSVFDFGTGTGILAILAKKLGANRVVGVDNDAWCIENAKENIQVNQVPDITIHQISQLTFQESFGIVLANINRHILLENMDTLYLGLENQGKMILSGLLIEDEAIIQQSAELAGFQHVKTLHRNGWIAICYVKNCSQI